MGADLRRLFEELLRKPNSPSKDPKVEQSSSNGSTNIKMKVVTTLGPANKIVT